MKYQKYEGLAVYGDLLHKIRNSQEKRKIFEIHEILRKQKKIIRCPSLLFVLGLEYKKKNAGSDVRPAWHFSGENFT